jgi:hypothetical protein
MGGGAQDPRGWIVGAQKPARAAQVSQSEEVSLEELDHRAKAQVLRGRVHGFVDAECVCHPGDKGVQLCSVCGGPGCT